MYFRPNDLRDRVIDFGSTPAGYIPVKLKLDAEDKAIRYELASTAGAGLTPPTLISTNGGNAEQYSVVKEIGSEVTYIFNRFVNNPGAYTDNIKYYYDYKLYSQSAPEYNLERPYVRQSNSYSYLVFQKAIGIVKVDDVLKSFGSQINGSQNDTVTLDISLSRGYERGLTILIQKRNGSNFWVDATADVDYELATTETTNIYELTFLNDEDEYRIIVTAIGYDSNNNPFGDIDETRTKVSENKNIFVFYYNTGLTAPVEEIDFPNIDVLVSTKFYRPDPTLDGEDDDVDETKAYTENIIEISPDIDYVSGIWLIDSIPKVVTDDEWEFEIKANTDVYLKILNNNNEEVLPAMKGFGPHQIVINTEGEYNFKYVMTLLNA